MSLISVIFFCAKNMVITLEKKLKKQNMKKTKNNYASPRYPQICMISSSIACLSKLVIIM